MKKILISLAVTVFCAGVCIGATYTIKNSASGSTTIKGPSTTTTTTTTTNLYNNYSSSQYVQNNTVNSSYAGIIDIVMDFSGSMSSVVHVASQTMASVVAQIPSDIQLGLRVFGQGNLKKGANLATVKSVQKTTNSEGKTVYKLQTGKHESTSGSCKATRLVTPIAKANAGALISGIQSVELGGATPMVYALEQAAYNDLSKFSRDIPKKIILITDGGENCGGDPCAFAKTLMSQRRDIQIDVVLVSSYSRSLQCLATTTGGKVYNLSNVNQFANVMTQSIQDTPQTPVNTEQNYEFIGE